MIRRHRVGRDKYRQPFASDSIWNRPIGSSANYVTLASLASAKGTTWRVPAKGYSVDESWISLAPQAPQRKLIDRGYWWPYPQSVTPIDSGARVLVPDDFVIPAPAAGNTPNNMAAMLTPDPSARFAQEFQYACRPDPATDVTFHHQLRGVWDLYGDGLSDGFGSHGGSGLNCLGGTIRGGELTGTTPIAHALSVTINTQKWACTNGGGIVNGYRWPATAADSNYMSQDGYGSNMYYDQATASYKPIASPGVPLDGLGMGALLAIPSTVSIASLALETAQGQLVAGALQGYGAYVVDTSADSGDWDTWLWNLDQTANRLDFPALDSAYGWLNAPLLRDLNKLILNLAIVANNAPGGSCAGGGAPIRPIAPPLL